MSEITFSMNDMDDWFGDDLEERDDFVDDYKDGNY